MILSNLGVGPLLAHGSFPRSDIHHPGTTLKPQKQPPAKRKCNFYHPWPELSSVGYLPAVVVFKAHIEVLGQSGVVLRRIILGFEDIDIMEDRTRICHEMLFANSGPTWKEPKKRNWLANSPASGFAYGYAVTSRRDSLRSPIKGVPSVRLR